MYHTNSSLFYVHQMYMCVLSVRMRVAGVSKLKRDFVFGSSCPVSLLRSSSVKKHSHRAYAFSFFNMLSSCEDNKRPVQILGSSFVSFTLMICRLTLL